MTFAGHTLESYTYNTVVVGTGAAGFNAADTLYNLGQQDVAIVTEGLNMGTSRNTGSDKQTYYKLTTSGGQPDSIWDMAQSLFAGGSMHGDVALVEAAMSAQGFYNLVRIGVPFPHNKYGEYVGYKTDHDPRQRASSIGPLTSRRMVEKLQQQVEMKGIPIHDSLQVIAILTDQEQQRSLGLLAINKRKQGDPEHCYVLISCTNIVYATGGPAGLYNRSVYPQSQNGATGIALEAGATAQNLTESQFGLASLKFRWNLSGTYQQVLPRYMSTAADGSDEREFLQDWFEDPGSMLDAVFLKGYQWPFDPRKTMGYGSSLIDILVYQETMLRGRRVFLDFCQNPTWQGQELDFAWLGEESHTYLANSKALFGTPIARLQHMNQPAIDLYRDNGIDLTREPLEIAVCAQHNNGGLMGSIWWESNLKHFFPVGEVNGSHGVYRPGGSALNSGQVGSARAAQFIAARYTEAPLEPAALLEAAGEQVRRKLDMGRQFLARASSGGSGPQQLRRSSGDGGEVTAWEVGDLRRRIADTMDQYAGCIRSADGIDRALNELWSLFKQLPIKMKLAGSAELGRAFQNYDRLVAAITYLAAIRDYIHRGGGSRGSYLVAHPDGEAPLAQLPDAFRHRLDDGATSANVQQIRFAANGCDVQWVPVRPIPEEDQWFEEVWQAYREDKIIR